MSILVEQATNVGDYFQRNDLSKAKKLLGFDSIHLTVSTNGHDEPSTGLDLADVEAGFATLGNAGAFAAEAWRKTRTANVA